MKEALGIFEIRSLVAAIEAADCMVKAADVKLVDFNFVGSGVISVMVRGEVAAVKAAIDSAKESIGDMAEIISMNVIPRPHDEVEKIL
ncbi:BMC domain-containing protein [Crassaminicella thermophila]|uniref:BMC domain-containing protein n=1 Tax=Crassaminicella thermophila TaxID=2599308 RepID=A0A5C0SJQ6_CRATE|nr:BMC domain-containing protein [Crassaminicella thermophila]QEK13169.1 BMC domain-containing protein [Crassaminicella thermophila]